MIERLPEEELRVLLGTGYSPLHGQKNAISQLYQLPGM